MFCGWGHLRGCRCQICTDLYRKSPRFSQSRTSIMKVNEEQKGVEEMIRKPRPGERSGPVEAVFNDADFLRSYPTLAAFLTDTQYDDRSPRTTATILIFCENGILRLCLNDRDNNRSVFFTSETVEGCLICAENALCSNGVEWRTRNSYNRGGQSTPF